MAHDRMEMEMFRAADSGVEGVKILEVAAGRRVGKALVDVEHGTWIGDGDEVQALVCG
jgi:hypothetical protein